MLDKTCNLRSPSQTVHSTMVTDIQCLTGDLKRQELGGDFPGNTSMDVTTACNKPVAKLQEDFCRVWVVSVKSNYLEFNRTKD